MANKIEKAINDAKAVTKATVKEAKVVKEAVKEAATPVKEDAAKVKETVKVDVAEKAVKKTVAAAKKTTSAVKKTNSAVKKTASAVKKAVKKETTVFVQYAGNEFNVADIKAKVEAAYKAEGHRMTAGSDVQIYIKPEDNAAYYVIGKNTGKVEL